MVQIAARLPWQDATPDAGGEQAIPRHDPHVGPPHRVDEETLADQSHERADDENVYANQDPMAVFFALADRIERIRALVEELADRQSLANIFTVPVSGFGDATGNLTLAFDPIPYGWSWAVDRVVITTAPAAVVTVYDSIASPMAFRGRFTVDANGYGVDIYPTPLILTSGESLTLRCTGLGAAGTPATAIVQVRQFTK